MTTETTTPAARDVMLVFSRDGRLFYAQGFDYHTPRNWCAVEPNADGKYEVLPFAFYEVKAGESRSVPETDPLVTLYAKCEGWPERGSAAWVEEITRVRANTENLLQHDRRSVRYHEDRIAYMDSLLAHYGPSVVSSPA